MEDRSLYSNGIFNREDNNKGIGERPGGWLVGTEQSQSGDVQLDTSDVIYLITGHRTVIIRVASVKILVEYMLPSHDLIGSTCTLTSYQD